MAKKVTAYIKLQVPAGAANPSPPVGPALGQHGLNIMEFCKAFNAQTQEMENGLPIPVVITAYSDRSFTFVTKTPPAAVLLKKAAGLKSGSGTPNTKRWAALTAISSKRSPAPSGRISMRRTWTRRCAPSPGRPAAWASKWRGCKSWPN